MANTKSLPFRYALYAASVAGFLVTLPLSIYSGSWTFLPVIFAVPSLIGTWDLIQKKRTVSRNYPILAHFRYFFESIGPEIRQYFIQSDTEERPFSREQRTIIYQRAKNVLDKRPFGSQLGMYDEGFEWINHSLR
jgi:glutamate synthase domain-containing protein 2